MVLDFIVSYYYNTYCAYVSGFVAMSPFWKDNWKWSWNLGHDFSSARSYPYQNKIQVVHPNIVELFIE